MLTYQKYQLNWCCKRFFYQLWCFNAIPLNMMSLDHFRWLKPKSRLLVVQHPHRLTVSPPRLWWSHRGVETACPGYFLFKAIPKTISTTKNLGAEWSGLDILRTTAWDKTKWAFTTTIDCIDYKYKAQIKRQQQMSEHTTDPRPLDIVTPSSSHTKPWLASRSSWSSSCWRAAVSPLSCFSLRFTSTIHKSTSTIHKDDFTQERISDERDAVINRFLFTCWLKSTLSCSLPEEKKGKVKENNQKHMKEVCFA